MAYNRNQQNAIKWIKNVALLLIILGWAWVTTVHDYDTNVVYGTLTMGGADLPNNGPLKIKLVLEQDEGFPESYVVRDYAFDFKGLTQQPRNYVLRSDIFNQVRIDSDTLSFLPMGSLEIENTTGTVIEKDIHQVSGFIPFDKTHEDSAADNITHILDYGMVTIGELNWTNVTGNITMKGNETVVSLIDRPFETE